MSPPLPCNYPIHPIPPNFQPLTTVFNTLPPLFGIGPKHPKSQKNRSKDIAEGVAVVLVALFSGNQKGKKSLLRVIYQLLLPIMMKWKWIYKKRAAVRDTSGHLPSTNLPISVSALKLLSSNTDSRSILRTKTPSFSYPNVYPPIALKTPSPFLGGIKYKVVISSLSGESYSLKVSPFSFDLSVSTSAISKPIFVSLSMKLIRKR